MNHHQPHHIDEIAEGAKRTHTAFGRPIEEGPQPGDPEETVEALTARIDSACRGSHRTHNAFGRALYKASEARHNAFGRLLEPDEED